MYNQSIEELEKAISKNDELLITDVWSDLSNYKEIESILLKNGFKLYYKRPVYYKKVGKIKDSILIFKKGKALIKKMFSELLKKTENMDFLEWKADPAKSFKEIYSSNPRWNLCAYKDDELIGFLTLNFNEEINYGTIKLIYVKDEFRGKNYAAELLKKAEELFLKAGINNWYESTHESNISMIKVFEKYGFKYKRDLIYFIRKK